MKILFRKLHPEAQVPQYQTSGSAGLDLHARISHEIYLQPGVRFTCPTGVAIELPEGFEAQVRPRSGLAIKHGVTLVNGIGCVDSDYRGEIMFKFRALKLFPKEYLIGDRIGQIIILPYPAVQFIESDELSSTERGEGGFGSTGK